jgi:uncharacterized repeat protein (TIGR01451 family)
VKNTYRIRAKASDKGGLSTEAAFAVSVNDVNEAPTDITLSNSSVDENMPASAVVGTFSGTDPNPGDTLTFSLLPGEGNTYFSVYDGTILKARQTFDYETRKTYGISVLADDGNGGTYRKDFTVTVNDVNDAPVISEIADQEIHAAETHGRASLQFTVGDPDTPADKLTVSGKSSDPKLLPLSGIVFAGTGTDRSLTLTPVSGKSGSAEVTVTVSDGELTAETAFTLTVTVLPAPVFEQISVKPTAPDSAVAPGQTLSFTAVIPNTGNADAAGTVFTLPIPANTAYVPESVTLRFTDIETGKTDDFPGVSPPEYDEAENLLIWEGDIPAGMQAEIVFDVIADADLQTGDVISAEGWTFAFDSDGDGVNDVTVKAAAGDSGSSGGVTVVVPDEPECLAGDVNGDGDITLADAVAVLQILTSAETADAPAICADTDSDGKIGFAELLVVLMQMSEP